MPGNVSNITVWEGLLALILLTPAAQSQDPAAASSGGDSPEAVLFENVPIVEAATLHAQTLQEAPASVTDDLGRGHPHVRIPDARRSPRFRPRLLRYLRSRLSGEPQARDQANGKKALV